MSPDVIRVVEFRLNLSKRICGQCNNDPPYFNMAFRKMSLPKLSLLVLCSAVWLAFLGSLSGFLQEARRQQDTAQEKELLGAVNTQMPPVPWRHMPGSAAQVLLLPTGAALPDYLQALLLRDLANNLWGWFGGTTVQREIEAFPRLFSVIFERPCGRDNPSLADSSNCCLGYPSVVEGLFSGVSRIAGQQCHHALSGLCALRVSPSEVSCGLNSPWWVFDFVLVFPFFQRKFIL